ncbi:MATE family efflux transporter [Piscirickettsia salmonis]|uniref:MATE family efflux transporter n=1 Tax=Piscirickettsia salmonis TaxID=1238 RepID=UPI0007C9901E|nr:Multidrug resistance protein NorM [Piscirickettsiaceae bacterium NZ-RLO1]
MGKLLHFAYPIILSRLVQTLGLVIGNIFVAQLGNTALAASALATSISIAFFTFANGCLFSLGPKFADCKKSKLMLAQLLSQALILSIILGLFIIIIFCHISYLLALFNQNPALIPLVKNYFYALSFAIVPMLLTSSLQQYWLSQHQEKYIFYYSLIRLIIGILLNYLFIFGLNNHSGFGFIGLAIGVSVSSWFGFFLLLLMSYYKYSTVITSTLTAFSLHKTYLQPFIHLIKTSLPIGLQMSLELIALMIGTLLIGHFGHSALSAWQIVNQYVLLFTMIPFGLSQATSILVSEEKSKTIIITQKSIILVTITAIITGLLYISAPNLLAIPYLSTHVKSNLNEPLYYLKPFFQIMAVYQLFDSSRLILIGSLRGHLLTFRVFLIGLFSFWLIALPISQYCIHYLNWQALSIPLSFTTALLFALVLTAYQLKIKLRNIYATK